MSAALAVWACIVSVESAGRYALGYVLQRVREVVYGCSWYRAASPLPPEKSAVDAVVPLVARHY